MNKRDPSQSVKGPSLRRMLREVIAPLQTNKRRTVVRVTVAVSLTLLTVLTVTRVAFDISVDNLRGQLSYDDGCYEGATPEVFGRYLDELRWDPMKDTNAGVALASLSTFVSFSLVDAQDMAALEDQQQQLYEDCALLDDVRDMHQQTGLLLDDKPRTRRLVITLAKLGPRAL